ncbi:putative regulator of Ras-like GTPase activity (Roadblock/LC7/MglB family) [Kibdelosporangium banguiense]|uniref:Regulator of Ras-like GTPase activity (Roadblock/LC7/MglB family) n=1 Tax=Kibdelosporangium banguiense TaxID=1365924 RepID=A0ABS4TQ55_9PSEU|nr:roadblock/LC7 domain-containing protein [Kibdelosporangium banguiense]MBP2326094.1 putative regulator of Ras-like GTPase activity (Roadblock/LC7/MglB family) [Kibdelosporangium banguiense]
MTPKPITGVTVTREKLQYIHGRVNHVNGLLVATRDGLLLSSYTRDLDAESVSAMASAAMGLAIQFTGQAKVGHPRATMFEGADGHVCVFPIDATTLLVVLGARDTTMGLFNVAAKQALSLLKQSDFDGEQ